MKRVMRAAVAMALMLAFTVGSTIPAEALTLRQRADQVMFGGNHDFIRARNVSPKTGLDARFNWSSDNCSVPTAVKLLVPVAGIGSAVFSDQCKQHDYGWRNYGSGLQLSRTWWTKYSIDSHFGSLMGARCGTWWIRFSGQEPGCRLTANAFQAAVTVAPW